MKGEPEAGCVKLPINNSTSEYINFYYDGNHARWKSVYVNGRTTETTIYVGDLMEKVMRSANSRYHIP
jgi:hypothetical protein